MSDESKKLMLYSVISTLVVWFLITKFYLHWSPFGDVGSIAIALAAGALGLGIVHSIGKALARQVPPTLYILGLTLGSGAVLLTTAYLTASVVHITIDCSTHSITGTELNRFEQADVVFQKIVGPVESKLEFSGSSPLWENNKRKRRIKVVSPGSSPAYRVNGSDNHYHFQYSCGSESPSTGMIQIPRQM